MQTIYNLVGFGYIISTYPGKFLWDATGFGSGTATLYVSANPYGTSAYSPPVTADGTMYELDTVEYGNTLTSDLFGADARPAWNTAQAAGWSLYSAGVIAPTMTYT
jgi:hypothetical protein